MDFLMVITPLQIEFFLNGDKEYEEFKVLNHYDKTHKFKVVYDQNKYSVIPSEFKIGPKQKVICKIKPLEKVVLSNGGLDQIYIQMFDDLTSQPLAIRSLDLKLSAGDKSSEQRRNSSEQSSPSTTNEPTAKHETWIDSNKKKTILFGLFLGLLLLAVLPTYEVDTQTILPKIFHNTVAFKMICVFLMGFVASEFYHLLD